MLKLSDDFLRAIEAGATVVVPSRQRAAAVRLAYAAQQESSGRSVWPSPRVHSIGGWLQRLSQEPARAGLAPLPRVLPPHEEWLLWRESAARLLDSEPALAHSALSADSLADALQSAAQTLGDWAMREAGLAHHGTEARWLAEALRAVRAATRGIGAMPRADLRAALAHCVPSPADAVVGAPPGSASGSGADIRLAGLRLGAGISALPTLAGRPSLSLGTACVPRVVACADPPAEWRAAAIWCREAIEHDAAARLLVVIPDLATRRPAIERIFREVLSPQSLRQALVLGDGTGSLAFAIEGGRPLSDYPEPEAALQALRVLSRATDETELAVLLEAPWWIATGRGARARAAARLREELPRRLPPRALGERLRAVVGRQAEGDRGALEPCAVALESASARLAAGPAAGAHWASVIEAALHDLGWPGPHLADSATQQIRMQWRALLEQFVGALRLRPVKDATRAVALLEAMARREHFAPSSGDVPVLVTASIDAPVAVYDGIRVCGLQADRWPSPVRVDPFIPWELQRAAGVIEASPEGRLEEARSALEAFRCCTTDLVLSWSLGEDDAEWQPSPLLAPWLDEGARARSKDFVAAVRAERGAQAGTSLACRLRGAPPPPLEDWSDENGLPWPAEQALPGGAGALEDQIECPFRAYATRRLAAREEATAEQGLSALERGRLLHLALKIFWDAARDSAGLAALDAAARRGRLDAALDEAVRGLGLDAGDDPLRARLLARERDRSLEVGLAALGVDGERDRFEVLLREETMEAALGPARIKVRLDRVDRLAVSAVPGAADAGGALAVIDYKSGRPSGLKWSGPALDAVQLWAYALLLEGAGHGSVAAVGNFHLARKDIGYQALAATEGALPEARTDGWSAAKQDAATRVTALAADFLRGDARVLPRSKACTHCAFPMLCRKVDLGVDAGDGGEEGP